MKAVLRIAAFFAIVMAQAYAAEADTERRVQQIAEQLRNRMPTWRAI